MMQGTVGPARELELSLMMADLCGYTALTETHGALRASETVLRFVRMVEECLEPGVWIIDSIGDAVFCAGTDTLAIVRTAIRLRQAVGREPDFPRISTGLHRGFVVVREGRYFGAPINLTARLTSLAEGGQILCSERVVEEAMPERDLAFRAVGMRHLRNVVHSLKVFALLPDVVSAKIGIDPVCRMQVNEDGAAATLTRSGKTYLFCSKECARSFAEAPELYGG